MVSFSILRCELLKLLILWIKLSPKEYCVSQSPASLMINSVCIGSGEAINRNYHSLGQDHMIAFYSSSFNDPHNYVTSGNTEPSEAKTLVVEMYAVNSSHGRPLFGWIFIKIATPTTTKPGDRATLRLLYVQMEDEHGTAVGEFDNANVCSKNKKKRDLSVFKKRYIDDWYSPCAQVGPSATKVSNSISFVWWDTLYHPAVKQAWKSYFGKGKPPNAANLNWRLSHTSCDKPEKIRLRVHALTVIGKSKPKTISGTHRTSWITVNWVGAADILDPDEYAKCTAVKLYPPPATGSPPVFDSSSWIKSVEKKPTVIKNNTNFDIVRTKKFCKPIFMKHSTDGTSVSKFAGRCLQHDKYSVSNKNAHECRPRTNGRNASKGFMKYTDYLEKRKGCMQISRCPCQCRFGNIDNTSIITTNLTCPGFNQGRSGSHKNRQVELGVRTNSLAGTYILVHLAITFFTICLYVFASISLKRSTNLLGHSLAKIARSHRGMGYATFTLFVLVTLSGPMRPGNMKRRKVFMILHAALGILYYFCGMVALITSSWIPGSPSSDDRECFDSPFFVENSSSKIMPQVITWTIFDCGFHGVFILIQRWADNHLDIQRKMYFPLTSIFKGGERHDNKGWRYRNLMLIIYSIFNGGFVIKVMSAIGSADVAGCGFGPVKCSHLDAFTLRKENACLQF
ncbi:unnamed protein product [Orchesella dallaii]|uniref:Ferric-chelate reductase 1 n=1 Tax=Orchesella dallaii TaxID=48710 RepID=A0ABP1QT64_9HEXA